jgi:hypothetical protein
MKQYSLFAQEHQLKLAAAKAIGSTELLIGKNMGANLIAITTHRYLRSLALALNLANNAGLFTGTHMQANFDAIIATEHTHILVEIFLHAQRVDWFRIADKQAVFNAIITYPNLSLLNKVLNETKDASLLTKRKANVIFNTLIANKNLVDFITPLSLARRFGLLTGINSMSNFTTIIEHPRPILLAQALQAVANTPLIMGDSAIPFPFYTIAARLTINNELSWLIQIMLNDLNSDNSITKTLASIMFGTIIAYQATPVLYNTLIKCVKEQLFTPATLYRELDHVLYTIISNNELNRLTIFELPEHAMQTIREQITNHSTTTEEGSLKRARMG